ncbi:MAG: hypothetical protein OCD76_09935 [Reichenbachiella sp.]
MKSIFAKILILGIVVGVFACKEEEKEPDPIYGEWVLDDAVLSNPPAGFESYDGITLPSLFGESEYVLEFFEDNTYERELKGLTFGDGSDVEDLGTFEFGDDFLELDPDEDIGLETDFDIIEEVNIENLVLGTTIQTLSLSDADYAAISDTVTSQATYDSLEAIYEVSIILDLTMEFDKD